MRVYITVLGVDYEGYDVDKAYLKRKNANKRLREVDSTGADWKKILSVKIEDV